jgi:hypothetical protein
MAGERVTPVLDWFHRESAGAPSVLRVRAAHYLETTPGAGDMAEHLAAAARAALSATLGHPGGRDVALDLLAADALVTLALKARAAADPLNLGRFAARLRAAGSGSS